MVHPFFNAGHPYGGRATYSLVYNRLMRVINLSTTLRFTGGGRRARVGAGADVPGRGDGAASTPSGRTNSTKSRLQHPIDDAPNLKFAHVVGFGNLPDGIARIDVRHNPPLFHTQVDVAQTRIRPIRKAQRHVQIGQFILELFPLLYPARALHNDVFQIDRHGDPIFWRQNIGFKAKGTIGPSKHPENHILGMAAHTPQDILLCHLPRFDQHHSQTFIIRGPGSSEDGTGLLLRQLARFEQHLGQVPILSTQGGKNELSLFEAYLRLLADGFNGKRTGLSSQIDEVQQAELG